LVQLPRQLIVFGNVLGGFLQPIGFGEFQYDVGFIQFFFSIMQI
jgi:hypothetical protein